MSRLNLTLDDDTSNWIKRHASREKVLQAALARRLIQEAVARRKAMERLKKLAADYAAGRKDAVELLDDSFADAQLELLDDE